MDYGKSAKEVLKYIGGKENLISAAHCATRLRIVIGDDEKCSKKELEAIDGVKGVFFASGQLQVIFGTGTVNKVYDEFVKEAGVANASKAEVKQAAASKANWFQRLIKTLGDVFVPIIPAIVASGLLMGLLEGLCKVWPDLANSGTYTIIHLFSNAAFVFLPILIAVSAAKVFGGNIYLGAVIGMIMIHSDLMNAWSVASADTIPTASVWFGLYDINMVGYQGHVIPVVIAVWFMSTLEKKLHKIVPEIIDLFVTPLVTVLVTGYLTLTIFGPIFSFVENGVLNGVQFLISIPFGVGAALAGAVYAPTVVAGVHHMYNALEAGLISSTGVNTWMPIATAANVAQGAAAMAIAVKTKNTKLKSLALPASLSAFMGITEPAIFGVNLRFFKSFIAGCIGGACGALVGSLFQVSATAYGVTGLFGILITTDHLVGYLILMVVAAVVAFLLSWMMFKDEKEEQKQPEVTEEPAIEEKTATEENPVKAEQTEKIVYAPLTGQLIPLANIADETFASGVLGQGVAVMPVEGKVVAPFDGEVSTVFPSKHAIGLTSEDGVEVLIHVGMNTVELDGEGYTSHVEEGTKVKKGDLLLEFDMEKIKEAGYDLTTPVLVTNTDDYEAVEPEYAQEITMGSRIITIK